MAGATTSPDGVTVRYTKDQVKDSPDIDIYSTGIATETERDLYGYYGLEYSDADYSTGLSDTSYAGGGSRRRAGDSHSTRGRAGGWGSARRRGSVRLKKWVETEPVQVDVELQRETARVTREAVDQPVSDVAIGEEEVEVQLTAEEAVAEKRTVAKERIGIEKDVEADVETVTEQVRKERVEVEGDEDPLSR